MTIDATEIIDEADEQLGEWQEYLRPAAEYFHENEGKLFERREALDAICTKLNIEKRLAQSVVSGLVGDTVDPVIQVPKEGSRYVGVVEYEEFDGAYGYVSFHDSLGKRRRVICQKCVNEATVDTEVTHATAGDPKGSFGKSASYEELVAGIHEHYDNAHDVVPSDIETGASLASGTTIGGNTAFHAGNDGDGSGLDADTVDGNEASNLGSGDDAPLFEVARHKDTDGTTDLSFDSGTLPAYDEYVIIYNYVPVYDGKMAMQLNINNYNQDFYYTKIQTDPISESKGTSFTNIGITDNRNTNGELVVTNPTDFAPYGKVQIYSRGQGYPQNEQMISGVLTDGDVPPVTSIQMSTGLEAKAKIVIYGRNL
jgi:hypothetical protein